MANRQEPHLKRPQCHLIWPSAHDCHRIGGNPMLFQLAPGNIGGECAGVDGRTQTRIGMANSAHMVFMCMGDKHAINAVFARLKPGNIRNDQINPG